LTALPHIKAGELKPLAVTTAKRSRALPDIPTITECGVGDYDLHPAMGMLAPLGTAPDLVARLSDEIAKILRMADVRLHLQSHGMEPIGTTPDAFAAHIPAARRKWAEVVREAGITIADAPPAAA